MDWSALFPDFVVEESNELSVDKRSTEANNQEMTCDGTTVREELSDKALKITRPRKINKNVEVADIGCGFGGLLVALAPQMPDTLILGQFTSTTKRKPVLTAQQGLRFVFR